MATQFLSTNATDNVTIYTDEATQSRALGTSAVTVDGRTFRYVKAGASALVPGTLYQAPALIANHSNIAVSGTPVVGTTSVTVTLGATAATLNQYAGGDLIVLTGTGAGQTYGIVSHPAAGSGATLVLTLSDEILSVFSGTFTLVPNAFSGIIPQVGQFAGGSRGASSSLSGVAVYPVTASQYGWVQTYGISNGLAAYTGGGNDVIFSGNVIGPAAFDASSGGKIGKLAAATVPQIGFALAGFADSATDLNIPIFLTLD